MLEMYKDDIQDRMQRLDLRASLEFTGTGRFTVTIVGGGMLVLRGYVARATDDIDVLEADKRLYGLMELYDMNGRVNAYMNSFPFNYEDRIKLEWSGRKIDYYTASLEDVVIAKLCGSRDRDWEDLKEVARHVNWDILEKLATDEDELRNIKMSDREYFFFIENYKDFRKEHQPCVS